MEFFRSSVAIAKETTRKGQKRFCGNSFIAAPSTAQQIKLSIKGFYSKCDQIRILRPYFIGYLRHLLHCMSKSELNYLHQSVKKVPLPCLVVIIASTWNGNT